MIATMATPAAEALSTNAAKRDKQLTARLALLGATFVKTETDKYGSGLTRYAVYFTFPGDGGPAHTYEKGREIPAWYGYCLRFEGAARLDRDTAETPYLAREVYKLRHDHRYETRKVGDLYRTLNAAESTYGRAATAAAVGRIRGTGDRFDSLATLEARETAALAALTAATRAYDAATAQIVAEIGEWPPYVR